MVTLSGKMDKQKIPSRGSSTVMSFRNKPPPLVGRFLSKSRVYVSAAMARGQVHWSGRLEVPAKDHLRAVKP